MLTLQTTSAGLGLVTDSCSTHAFLDTEKDRKETCGFTGIHKRMGAQYDRLAAFSPTLAAPFTTKVTAIKNKAYALWQAYWYPGVATATNSYVGTIAAVWGFPQYNGPCCDLQRLEADADDLMFDMLAVEAHARAYGAPAAAVGYTAPSAAVPAATGTYLKHSLLPAATSKPPTFANITTVDQAQQYARAGFHAVVSSAPSAMSPFRPLFETAAKAYFAAAGIGVAGSVPLMKQLLHVANVAATAARAVSAPQPVRRQALKQVSDATADGVANTAVGASHKTFWYLLGGAVLVGGVGWAATRKARR